MLDAMLAEFADTVENLRIRSDMLRTGQALGNAAPAQALAHQAGATNSLHALKRLLAGWKAEETGPKTEEGLNIVRDTRELAHQAVARFPGLPVAARAVRILRDAVR